MAFNMVRQGLFGEMLHAEGGYLHDLRDQVRESQRGCGGLVDEAERQYRRTGSVRSRTASTSIAAIGSISGLDEQTLSRPAELGAEHFPADAPQRQEKFVLGDVNTSLIKTAMGRTIMVQHCTNLPRPYSRINIVQGRRSVLGVSASRVYRGPRPGDQWVDAAIVRRA